MKALLIQAGLESKSHGASSPVWSNKSFRFIPPPAERKGGSEKRERSTYKSMDLIYLLPDKVQKKFSKLIVHNDPEFKTFTYGEQDKSICKELNNLSKGDLLVFFAEGELQNNPSERGYFIIGYFIVKSVVEWDELDRIEQKQYKAKLKNNAHIRSSKPLKGLVIVVGLHKSKLLKKCIALTEYKEDKDKDYAVAEDVRDFLGIGEKLTKTSPLWIKGDDYLRNLKMLLGLEPVKPEEFEDKIPFCLFSRIVDNEKRLSRKEKIFLINFMISKSADYRSDAENFGNDMYWGGFKNVDILDEYFTDYWYKL